MVFDIPEWTNLILRWLHVIAGIAWIGSSFFFNWLDSRLTAPRDPRPGIEGELWMVHSGGFYQMEKIQLAPDELPRELHWVKWEAGVTWISGILLFGLIYYLGAKTFLIDAAVRDLSPAVAVAVSVVALVAAWAVYDVLWQSPLAKDGRVAGTLSVALAIVAAYVFSQVFSGRAAYMQMGVLLGTLMAANVWMRIVPAQRQLVAATKAGTTPDARLANNAKLRSLHNNYMTLPVVFIMLSGHYPMTFGHPMGWAVLAALSIAGALVRHYFNLRNRGREARGRWALGGGTAIVVALAIVLARPNEPTTADAGANPAEVGFTRVSGVLATHCLNCHSAQPSHEAFDEPPGGIMLDTPAQVRRYVPRIKKSVVDTEFMPLGNQTEMTPEERAMIGRWIAAGAVIE